MKQLEASGKSPNGVSIRVWDLPVRIFHWAIVVLVALAWLTKEIGGNAMTYHMWIGYSILALVVFRLVWGFVGSQHARFSDFLRGPVAVLRYLRGTADGSSSSHGHNPIGGWSVLALLACLFVQAATGLFANDEIATEGPLAARVGLEWSDWLTTIHRYSFDVLLVLIGLHVAAVMFYLVVKRENLILPMVTGRKRVHADHASEGLRVGLWRAVLALLVSGGLVALLVEFA